jgi:Tn7-like transposition protein D/TniQ
MLGFFPTPYPDELLYSIIARYHIRSGNISPKITLQELFGSTTTIATPDLPANLNNLSKRLQHLIPNSAGDLIDRYTLYPFYRPFLPPQSDRSIQKSMKARTGSNIHTRAGIMASAISMPRYFRFCPECNAEDLDRYGEMYWHRIHQISGVFICPKHSVFLQDSSVSFQGFNRHEYYAASSDNCLSVEKSKTYGDFQSGRLHQRTQTQLHTLATDISWLLDRNIAAHSPEYFQQQYRSLLIDREYANSNGRVRRDRLDRDFRLFYSQELLALLDSSLEENSDSQWLFEITRKHRKSFHPIRHLLLIRFLTDSVEQFFRTKYRYQPFGKAPWICLNPADPNYRQAVVTDLKISHCLENKRPLGVFSCACGMIYCRTGPDESEEDRYQIGKIIEFGELWQQKLRELVEGQKLGLRAIARELRVDTRTVKRYVSSLKLESHWEQRAVKSDEPIVTESVDRSLVVERQKERWIALQQQYPNQTKTELRKLAPAVYAQLYRNDRDWLKDNSPALQQPTATNDRVDWVKRDLEVLDRVKLAVDEMLKAEKPQRLTISGIGKQVGLLALLEQHLDLMPMTGDYLGKVTESIEDFQIRRIRWAVGELDRRREPVVSWRVMRLAGLGENISDRVQRALEDDLQLIS